MLLTSKRTRLIPVNRFVALAALVVGLSLAMSAGVADGGTAGSKRVLEFGEIHVRATPAGLAADSTAAPVGSTLAIKGLLVNNTPQFGKPRGAVVGRILLGCTVLSVPLDGICTGIVHVPDGFFTIAGNGPFTGTSLRYYAITGGVGAYANDRGELETAILSIGRQLARVTLYS
jgi:hypothetical protein